MRTLVAPLSLAAFCACAVGADDTSNQMPTAPVPEIDGATLAKDVTVLGMVGTDPDTADTSQDCGPHDRICGDDCCPAEYVCCFTGVGGRSRQCAPTLEDCPSRCGTADTSTHCVDETHWRHCHWYDPMYGGEHLFKCPPAPSPQQACTSIAASAGCDCRGLCYECTADPDSGCGKWPKCQSDVYRWCDGFEWTWDPD